MNIKLRNNTKYYYESFWRSSKNDTTQDSFGNPFPYPKHSEVVWTDKNNFIKKLIGVQNYVKTKNKYVAYDDNDKFKDSCLICGEKNILNGSFKLNNTYWNDDIVHYIDKHNLKPSEEFIDLIYKFNPIKNVPNRIIKYESDLYNRDDIRYIKLEKNQIMIFDALMRHGGYTKKYIDKKNTNVYRYSEHAGSLDFNKHGLDKIIISGKTSRVDIGDEEIFLPGDMPYALDYEYVFHTHPPTPKPGGRVTEGILYEFPSVSDIFHFIDHYNEGMTQGSLVITSEGLYNIRKLILDNKNIKINEDHFYKEYTNAIRQSQHDAIKKYTTNFTSHEFYSKIASDIKYIDDINLITNKYKIHIDYFPRQKDKKGNWIIESIYLPVFVTEPILKKNK